MQTIVQDVMTVPQVTVPRSTTLDTAINLTIHQGVSEIYVNDESGRLAGVVPDYELLKANLTKTPGSLRIEKLMSRNMMTLAPETPIEEASPLFRDGRYSRVAVVENGRLVGQITRRDILRYHQGNQQPEGTDETVETSPHAPSQFSETPVPATTLRKPMHRKFVHSAERLGCENAAT